MRLSRSFALERIHIVVFNSFQYLAFFPIVAVVFFALPLRVRWAWLLLASLYFYGIWNPVLLFQLVATVVVAFVFGVKIEETADKAKKKRLLTLGITLFVANLFVFKYTAFVNETFRSLFGFAGATYPVPVVRLLLPLGLSFYTFQIIAYLVDVYRGEKAERHLGIFGVFVTFFPKLVSGPIERGKALLPQLRNPEPFDYARAVSGVELIVWGLFKKVVVADRVAPAVSRVYDDPRAWDGPAMVLATWLFAFQVYCDFSGYTDMARGSAQILGYRLMENFNRPYFATSIGDFWKRWHISLTTWLTDYIYTPLTRQRRFKIKLFNLILISLFITFVASGLWHGAQWTFVAWGALHGIYLVTSTLTLKWRAKVAKQLGLERFPRLHRAYKIGATFFFVCVAYVFFQSKTLSDAFYIITHVFSGWRPSSVGAFLSGQWAELLVGVAGMAVVLGVEAAGKSGGLDEIVAKRPAWVRFGVYQACALGILLLGAFYDANPKFIYFQF